MRQIGGSGRAHLARRSMPLVAFNVSEGCQILRLPADIFFDGFTIGVLPMGSACGVLVSPALGLGVNLSGSGPARTTPLNEVSGAVC